jgi:secreted Zn-dependent insulinase-like peptidase
MQGVYNALRYPQITPSNLQISLDAYRLNFQNKELEELYKQTSLYWMRWATNGSYACTQGKILEAIDNLRANTTWQQVEDEIRDMIKDVFVQSGQGFHEFTFLAGNVEDDDVRAIRSMRDAAKLTPTLPYPSKIDFFRPSFIAKSDAPLFLHKGVEHIPVGRAAVRLAVPVGNQTDPLASAFARTLDAVCAGQFFAALRTRDQLGYVVGSVLKSLHGILYMTFIVQTEKFSGTETLSKIEDWIQSWIVQGIGERDEYIEVDGVNNTTAPFEKHFNRIKDGVVAEWSSKHSSLEDKTAEQLSLMLNSADNLQLLDQTLDNLKNLTRNTFRDLVNTYFKGGRKDWRAIVLDGAKGDTSISTTLEGWSVITTKDNLDVEDGVAGPASS